MTMTDFALATDMTEQTVAHTIESCRTCVSVRNSRRSRYNIRRLNTQQRRPRSTSSYTHTHTHTRTPHTHTRTPHTRGVAATRHMMYEVSSANSHKDIQGDRQRIADSTLWMRVWTSLWRWRLCCIRHTVSWRLLLSCYTSTWKLTYPQSTQNNMTS